MRKSGQFWRDVDLAISTLMLRQLIKQIIIEGRNTGQTLMETDIEEPILLLGRELVLHRYHEVMKARLRHFNGQISF
jgi:hypothetical protein